LRFFFHVSADGRAGYGSQLFCDSYPQISKMGKRFTRPLLFCAKCGYFFTIQSINQCTGRHGKVKTTLLLMIFWTIATWILTPIGIYYYGATGVAASLRHHFYHF